MLAKIGPMWINPTTVVFVAPVSDHETHNSMIVLNNGSEIASSLSVDDIAATLNIAEAPA